MEHEELIATRIRTDSASNIITLPWPNLAKTDCRSHVTKNKIAGDLRALYINITLIFLYRSLHESVCSWEYTASNCRMIDEWWIWKDLEGSGCVLIEVIPRNKKLWEELIAYFPWYDTDFIENDVSKILLLLRVCSLLR
jgi:hypothetical protein